MGPTFPTWGPAAQMMRTRLPAVVLIYLFRVNWQPLVVSLEVAAAVSSQQMGDPLAGVGSRSPRNRGVS